MKTIYRRTLVDTLRVPAVILMLLAGLGGGYVLARSIELSSVPAYLSFLNRCLVRQHLVVFFLINGAMLFILLVSVCSGLIAGEVHEGTFRILVSKPNSRIAILVAKVLGMFTGMVLLMILGLSSMYAVELLMGNLDGNIIRDLLKYFPGYMLYGVIAGFFLSSLSVLISTVAKKKVIALLPMLAVILLILALPVILRVVVMISGKEIPWYLNFLDLNYHFALMFKWCCELFGPVGGSGSQLEILSILMNLFTSKRVDMDIIRQWGGSLYAANDALPSLAVLMVYMILGLINYLGSVLIINNKNV